MANPLFPYTPELKPFQDADDAWSAELQRVFGKNLAKYESENKKLRFTVYGGLNYIRGNSSPYFSLTLWGRDHGCEFGGASHDTILEHFPQFADLAAMHLSDIDGQPMHAETNGWYWLAGALGGAGEQFHGGNSHPTKSEDECLKVFADHCRVTLEQAETIKRTVQAYWNYPDMRKAWGKMCTDMRPRWKAEALACITHHNLQVYGDEWKQAS